MAAASIGPEDRLDSWIEIAAYLKRGVRTVQRWEQLNGLPVHRPEFGAVYAYKSELDGSWQSRKQMQQEPPAPTDVQVGVEPKSTHHFVWMAVGVVILTGLTAGLVWRNVSLRHGLPALAPVPLTSDVGREITPSLSPDGTQIAYVWNDAQQNDWKIYIKTIATEKVTRLTSGTEPEGVPAWSPDGRHIAFLRYSAARCVQFVLMTLLATRERIVIEIDGPGIMPAWSSDSRWIVFTDAAEGSAYLSAIDIDSGERRALTRTGPKSRLGMHPTVAVDGSGLSFVRSTGDISEL